MNLFFVICTVFGVTLLACLTLLSVLGLDQKPDFLDQNWKSGSEDVLEIGLTPIDGLSEPDVSQSVTPKPRSQGSPLRGIGAGIAFFGLAGSAAQTANMPLYQTFGLSFLAAVVAFLGISLLMRQLPFDPFREDSTVDTIQTQSQMSRSPNPKAQIFPKRDEPIIRPGQS